MCTIVLEKNIANTRFLTMNTILAKTNNFSLEEILKEIEGRGVKIDNIVETCLEDLMNNGLVYEIGSKYKVRNIQRS